jgi:CRP/FNR family transcriptional regulator, anaerobic regulatory protein
MQVIQFSQARASMEPQRKDIHNSEIPAVCVSCEARHGGICGTLSPSQLTELSRHTKRRKVTGGSEVIGQGEQLNAYSNILSGVVKLSKMMADGRQQIVGLQFAPDFMGRPFLRESQVAAEAAVDIEVCSMPKAIIDRMISDTPELEHKIHEQTLKELDEARDWMLTLGRKTAQEKVASFLHMIAMHIDPESADKRSFDLPLTRADIADFLGLTIETVSRQMTKLRRDGIIRIENNRHVTCPDMERLRRAAGND